jgi:hypothetical protein
MSAFKVACGEVNAYCTRANIVTRIMVLTARGAIVGFIFPVCNTSMTVSRGFTWLN